MVKYRVIIKISYHEAWYEFEDAENAVQFATTALTHMVDSDDQRKNSKVIMAVVDTDLEKQEEDDE